MKRSYVQVPKDCPYCHSLVLKKNGREVYDENGRDFGEVNVLVCSNNLCGARTTCDEQGYPYGTLAKEPLRKARIRAHDALDKFWSKKHYDRRTMYKLLANYMKKELDFCHIGLFNEAECEKVIEFCQKLGRFRITPP